MGSVKMTKRNLLVFIAVVAIGAVAWASPAQQESYKSLPARPAEQITGATGADSTTATTQIADRAQECRGNPTVAVQVDFSGAAADTCVVSVLLYHQTTFLGLTTATATAGAFLDAAGDNFAPLLFFETAGATHYEVRHATPSAGNVDLTWWSYGSRPQ